MPNVAVIGRIREEGIERLQALDGLSVNIIDSDVINAPDQLADTEAILVRTAKLTPSMIDAAKRLKVVSRHGVGYDNVPVDVLSQRRIPLCISATANLISVAEQALACMLALSKSLHRYDAALRRGDWAVRNDLSTFELFGKNLLVVGYGRIGRALVERALALGMTCSVFDPFTGEDAIQAAGARPVKDLDEALSVADVISLHLPRNEKTYHVINKDRLKKLQSHALLINTARGGLIDEAALADALRSNRIGGAALDVFEDEPIDAQHPLCSLPNVILTPHSAGVSRESTVRMAVEAADNIVSCLQGRADPSFVVNWAEIQA